MLGGCADPVEGFRVVFSSPQQGQAVPPSSTVSVGFSEAVDRTACNVGTLHLAALEQDDTIAWFEEVAIEESSAGEFRLELVHDDLIVDLDYVLAVQAGPEGCLSALGETLAPFEVTFTVKETQF